MWEKFKKHRFNYFLYSIVGMILVSPLSPPYGDTKTFPFAACFYTFAVILILGLLVESRTSFILFAVFYMGLLAINVYFYLTHFHSKETFEIIATVMHSIVLVFLLKRLLFFLFNVKKVTSDHVKGGVAIYFLMGILWGLFYRIVYYLDPGSFVISNPNGENLFYFSYVTLASLGYGDIIPTSSVTQMLAIMETTLGQIFIAVFISRLMGFRIAHELNEKG
jgi:hypothetical protein